MAKGKVARSETNRTKPPVRRARAKALPPARPKVKVEKAESSDGDQEFQSVNAEPMPPPPPPPKVEVLPAGAGGKKERWQDKYHTGFAGGREGICRQAAQLYCAILFKCAEYIESKGGTPLMGQSAIEETIFPAAVLTLDKFMPDIDVGPETEVAIGSGVILGQAAIVAMRSRKKKEPVRNGASSAASPPSNQEQETAEPTTPRSPPLVVFDINDPKTVF